MAKKTDDQNTVQFKEIFNEVKGDRTFGWEAEDSEAVAMKLIQKQIDRSGKEVKLTTEATARITAALQNTPKRIVRLIKAELEAAGAMVDSVTEAKLLWLVDLQKVRTDLVGAGIFQKGVKGQKRKVKVADLLK